MKNERGALHLEVLCALPGRLRVRLERPVDCTPAVLVLPGVRECRFNGRVSTLLCLFDEHAVDVETLIVRLSLIHISLSLAASVTAHPCVEQMHLNSVVSGTAVQGIVSAFRKTFFMGWTIKRSRAKIWCLKSPANQGFLESLNADILRLCPVAGKILAFPVAFASPLGGTFFAVFCAVARGEERLAAGGAGFYPVALLVRLGRDFGL